MKISRDSIKFLTKVIVLATVLIAGYAKKHQDSSPAKKGAVDLIITNDGDHKTPSKKIQTVKNQNV